MKKRYAVCCVTFEVYSIVSSKHQVDVRMLSIHHILTDPGE